MFLNWKKLEKGRKLTDKYEFQGFNISVETPKGSYRYWYDPHNEEEGKTKMKYDYGYITGLKEKGADGECLDVYIGPNEDADKVYIVHQLKAPDFEKYDEDKVMLGFESKKDAKQAYLMHYNKPGFLGDVSTMAVEEFRREHVKKAMDDFGQMSEEDQPDQEQDDGQADLEEDIDFDTPSEQFENDSEEVEKTPDGEIIPKIDPYDINNIQSVSNLLNSIGTMNEKDLAKLSARVWGEGYQYKPVTPTYVRSELRGFLQDQLEMLEDIPQLMVEQGLPDAEALPHADEELNTYGPESSELFEREPDQIEEVNNA